MSNIQMENGLPNLHATSEDSVRGYEIIDVRRPEEFTGELGHIRGAKLVTLGPDLVEYLKNTDKSGKYLFVCRSGGRSTQAALLAKSYGIEDVTNLAGGMIRWNDLQLKTQTI
jgi:rhodanese-related sulfurtransferase